MNKLQWHVEQSTYELREKVYCRDIETKAHVTKAENGVLIFESVENPGLAIDPFFCVEYGELQGLMDEMWRAGIRPNNGEGSIGQLGATERHLEDMRKLVFKTAGIK